MKGAQTCRGRERKASPERSTKTKIGSRTCSVTMQPEKRRLVFSSARYGLNRSRYRGFAGSKCWVGFRNSDPTTRKEQQKCSKTKMRLECWGSCLHKINRYPAPNIKIGLFRSNLLYQGFVCKTKLRKLSDNLAAFQRFKAIIDPINANAMHAALRASLRKEKSKKCVRRMILFFNLKSPRS